MKIRYFSLNVGSISFMRSLSKKMNKNNDSAFFGIPRSLLSSARNLPQWFIFFVIFVVSLYSNCVFEFNTESQNLSSNTSLFFFHETFFFFFPMCCFLLWRRIKRPFLLTEQMSLVSVNQLHICLFVFGCSVILSHAFIFEHQRSEICCKRSRSCSAPPHSLPATLRGLISSDFTPRAGCQILTGGWSTLLNTKCNEAELF